MRLSDPGKLFAAAALLALSNSIIFAHEEHDHGAVPAAISIPAMPRAEAGSDTFELVAVASGGDLTIYLDRFGSNEPVSDAVIAVETPQGNVDAKISTDGTYKLSAPWAEKPGRYDLIFTVTKGDDADVLTLTLDVPSVGASATAPGLSASAMAGGLKDRLSSNNSGVLVLAIVAFIAGGVGGLVLARRRRTALVAAVSFVVLLIAQTAHSHEGEDHSTPATTRPFATRDIAQVLSDSSVFVPKSTQRILAIRTVVHFVTS